MKTSLDTSSRDSHLRDLERVQRFTSRESLLEAFDELSRYAIIMVHRQTVTQNQEKKFNGSKGKSDNR